jgi:hypothetical protein
MYELKGREFLLPGNYVKCKAVLLKWHSTVINEQRPAEVGVWEGRDH